MDRNKYVNNPDYREGYDTGVVEAKKTIAAKYLNRLYDISAKTDDLINDLKKELGEEGVEKDVEKSSGRGEFCTQTCKDYLKTNCNPLYCDKLANYLRDKSYKMISEDSAPTEEELQSMYANQMNLDLLKYRNIGNGCKDHIQQYPFYGI